MELSEAKKECKDLIEEYLSCSVIGLDMQVDVSFGEKRCEAIDTVLKALDNSISKDDIRKKIEEINSIEWQPGIRTAGKSVKYWKMVGAENALKELLGEE